MTYCPNTMAEYRHNLGDGPSDEAIMDRVADYVDSRSDELEYAAEMAAEDMDPACLAVILRELYRVHAYRRHPDRQSVAIREAIDAILCNAEVFYALKQMGERLDGAAIDDLERD